MAFANSPVSSFGETPYCCIFCEREDELVWIPEHIHSEARSCGPVPICPECCPHCKTGEADECYCPVCSTFLGTVAEIFPACTIPSAMAVSGNSSSSVPAPMAVGGRSSSPAEIVVPNAGFLANVRGDETGTIDESVFEDAIECGNGVAGSNRIPAVENKANTQRRSMPRNSISSNRGLLDLSLTPISMVESFIGQSGIELQSGIVDQVEESDPNSKGALNKGFVEGSEAASNSKESFLGCTVPDASIIRIESERKKANHVLRSERKKACIESEGKKKLDEAPPSVFKSGSNLGVENNKAAGSVVNAPTLHKMISAGFSANRAAVSALSVNRDAPFTANRNAFSANRNGMHLAFTGMRGVTPATSNYLLQAASPIILDDDEIMSDDGDAAKIEDQNVEQSVDGNMEDENVDVEMADGNLPQEGNGMPNEYLPQDDCPEDAIAKVEEATHQPAKAQREANESKKNDAIKQGEQEKVAETKQEERVQHAADDPIPQRPKPIENPIKQEMQNTIQNPMDGPLDANTLVPPPSTRQQPVKVQKNFQKRSDGFPSLSKFRNFLDQLDMYDSMSEPIQIPKYESERRYLPHD